MQNKKWQAITRWALFFEEICLPIILLYFTTTSVIFLAVFRNLIWANFQELFSGGISDVSQISFLLDFNIRIIAIFFNLVTLLILFIRKKQPQAFDNAKELLVPLITIFFYFAYNLIPLFPKDLNGYLLPVAVLPAAFVVGNLLILIGMSISTVAILNLRDSFAVFVESRGVVSTGLYSFSRHPIYLGYLIKAAGACLLNFFPGYFFLSSLFVCLLIYRTVLEEKKLLKHCPGYAEYKLRTPSLFLKLFFLDRKNKARE